MSLGGDRVGLEALGQTRVKKEYQGAAMDWQIYCRWSQILLYPSIVQSIYICLEGMSMFSENHHNQFCKGLVLRFYEDLLSISLSYVIFRIVVLR